MYGPRTDTGCCLRFGGSRKTEDGEGDEEAGATEAVDEEEEEKEGEEEEVDDDSEAGKEEEEEGSEEEEEEEEGDGEEEEEGDGEEEEEEKEEGDGVVAEGCCWLITTLPPEMLSMRTVPTLMIVEDAAALRGRPGPRRVSLSRMAAASAVLLRC
jgi:hypothetical protein